MSQTAEPRTATLIEGLEIAASTLQEFDEVKLSSEQVRDALCAMCIAMHIRPAAFPGDIAHIWDTVSVPSMVSTEIVVKAINAAIENERKRLEAQT